MKLTPSQKKAVEYNEGPLLIIAGAGSGKTTVLVEKIKHLILKKKVKPEDVLALTFTDKAAREMEKRVDQALPYGYFQMNISTFHSFCDYILRDETSQIGLSPVYKLQSTAQQVYFLRQHLFLFDLDYYRPLGNPNKFIEGLLQHFSRLRDEDVSPIQYIEWAKVKCQKSNVKSEEDEIESKKYLELALAYKKYQDLKAKENVLDFADLIYYAVKLFRERPNVLKQNLDDFHHILVY